MRRFVNVKKGFSIQDKQFLPDALAIIRGTDGRLIERKPL